MNIEQQNTVIEFCKKFNTQKMMDWLNTQFAKDQSWETPVFDDYSINDTVQVTSKIFKLFNEIASSENVAVYKWEFNHPTVGNNNVGGTLQQMLSCFEHNYSFNDFFPSIRWAVKYLFEFNLWNKERTTYSIDSLEEKQTQLELLQEKTKRELSVLETLRAEYAKEKNEISNSKTALNQLIEQKKSELQVISDTLNTVTNQKNEIDSILKNVQNVDAQVRAIQQNHTEIFDQLKLQKENQETDFKNLVKQIDEDDTKLKSIITSGDEKIKYFQTLEQFILEKQKEIIELGALAAGAALGGTFGLREKKLEDGLDFWKKAVPSITILAMIWIIIVFTCLKSTTGVIWVDVVLNLAKTIPAFVLMGFVFKQYNKERNLQEEYAFKAAIANTIKAYADLVKNEDTKENATKQQMLSDAVKQVQTPPKLYSESTEKIFSFSTTGLNDSLKNLNETVKNLKG